MKVIATYTVLIAVLLLPLFIMAETIVVKTKAPQNRNAVIPFSVLRDQSMLFQTKKNWSLPLGSPSATKKSEYQIIFSFLSGFLVKNAVLSVRFIFNSRRIFV